MRPWRRMIICKFYLLSFFPFFNSSTSPPSPPNSLVSRETSLALWIVRACIGPEKNVTGTYGKHRGKKEKKKIKNSDADGPLTSKIERRRNIFSVWIHFPLMRNTFIDFSSLGRKKKTRTREGGKKKKSIMTIHLMCFFFCFSHREENVPNIIPSNKHWTNGEKFRLLFCVAKTSAQYSSFLVFFISAVQWCFRFHDGAAFLFYFNVIVDQPNNFLGAKINVSDGITQLLHKCQFSVIFHCQC